MPDAGLPALLAALSLGPCVRITLLEVRGSAPREAGAVMLVSAGGERGSIGGGRLEYAATQTARTLLQAADGPRQLIERQGLGPDLEQCCGGAVRLLFQRFEPRDADALRAAIEGSQAAPILFRCDTQSLEWRTTDAAPAQLEEFIAATRADGRSRFVETADGAWLVEPVAMQPLELCLFGAGHVGTALVPLLAELPFRIRWFDPRSERLPTVPPPQVIELRSDDPLGLVRDASDAALFLVMTHSHPLDEDICHAVLSRGRFAWLGLIGSRSKRARFVHRLARRGIGAATLERLTCPVGLAGVEGKRPATIALAIAAQLLAEQVPAALR